MPDTLQTPQPAATHHRYRGRTVIRSRERLRYGVAVPIGKTRAGLSRIFRVGDLLAHHYGTDGHAFLYEIQPY